MGLRGLAPQPQAELFEGGDAVRLGPGLVLGEACGALGGHESLEFQLPGPGGLLMDPQAPGQAVPTAVDQHRDELSPCKHPEQDALALGVSLELLGFGAVGDEVDARANERRVNGELLGGLGVSQSALADLGFADYPRLADEQRPVVFVPGTAPDIVRGADALRHQEVPDGVVSFLGVGSGGATALAGFGDVLGCETVVHLEFSGQLVVLLHDDNPLS